MSWESGLQDGGVSESFTHKMAAWEFCLQDGGVSESFTHKMTAWEFCLQYGGVSTECQITLNTLQSYSCLCNR